MNDPRLSMCQPNTRGIWMDLLCAMHELGRMGVISGTREQLARIGRCSTAELDHAIADLQNSQAADVAHRNDIVTVSNRRMKREANTRKCTVLRVAKHRCNGACNDSVTPQKSEYRSQSTEVHPPNARANPQESLTMDLEQAKAAMAVTGVLPEFIEYVFDDWQKRGGRDAGGCAVNWEPYCRTRWKREGTEWRSGTHTGQRKGNQNANNNRTNNQGADRNKGTHNEGRAHLYKNAYTQ